MKLYEDRSPGNGPVRHILEGSRNYMYFDHPSLNIGEGSAIVFWSNMCSQRRNGWLLHK